nr:hypothetical protein [Tanacetum cinerariifolium]
VNASTINRSIGFDNPVRGSESNSFEHPFNGRFVLRIIGFSVMSSMRTPSGIPLHFDFVGVTLWALNRKFSVSLEYLALILQTPLQGDCVYSDDFSLESLNKNPEEFYPYQTNIPTPN